MCHATVRTASDKLLDGLRRQSEALVFTCCALLDLSDPRAIAWWRAAVQFVLYALGMAVVLTAATFAVAFLRASVVSRLRDAGRWLQPLMGAVLLVVGGYIVYYWLSLGRLL